ncbi:MAG: YqgE/AlgH family protein [Rhizobacter sp.]|nr:YqgE/AlgH family protein [Ferruginibacter sp.]
MNIQPGTFLESNPSLDDPNFERVFIFIAGNDGTGVTGLVINNASTRYLNELVEFKHSKAFRLYEGGPVQTDKLYFMHRRPDIIENGIPLIAGVYLGGNFKQVVEHLQDNTINTNDLKIFIGYCGWDAGQLEEEIKEGSWIIKDNDPETIFIL